MYKELLNTIEAILTTEVISNERKSLLQPLAEFIQQKVDNNQHVALNFICTHNSRRSHLSQVWAQVASAYYNVPNVSCYSGGTEETALFPKIAETLIHQGFNVFKITDGTNPVYAIKYDENAPALIGFSKKNESQFNPSSEFAAIMTCSQADGGCPFIAGAEKRLPITYDDPKISDNSHMQTEVYLERSLQIAAEMFFVFSSIKI